jgi:NIMA (never in mitosis gene a)-related kinase
MKAIDLDQLDAKGKQDALREVGFLATLKHPAIIAYRDYFQVQEPAIGWRKAQNMLHIIMEFADGGDLSGRIRTQNNVMFPEHQVMLWLVQVCLALKHMHDRNVIHRDIKSENVFLTSTNIVKLGDFGISKHLANTLANAHTRIGTPYYLSPEICMDRPYNNKTGFQCTRTEHTQIHIHRTHTHTHTERKRETERATDSGKTTNNKSTKAMCFNERLLIVL